MKHIVNLNIHYGKDLSHKLYDFCWNHCEHIVLSKRANQVEDVEALRMAVMEKSNEISLRGEKQLKQAETLSLKAIKREGFKNKAELEKLIVKTTKEDLAVVNSYLHNYKEGSGAFKKDLISYGLDSSIISIGSYVTFPGIWDICFFNKHMLELETVRDNIFSTPILVGEYEFEDIAFADENKIVWMKVCAHEGFFQMELDEQAYREFLLYNIPHSVR